MNIDKSSLSVHRQVQTIDDLLEQYRDELDTDFEAYRNHVYRTFNLALVYAAVAVKNDAFEKAAMASVFHALGIWTDNTWDYIQPSIVSATKYLVKTRRKQWILDISFIISEQLKLSKCRGPFTPLAEAFRKAVWLDIAMFKVPTRLPRTFLAECLEAFPRRGFHKRMLELGSIWAKSHPFNPLPMLKF